MTGEVAENATVRFPAARECPFGIAPVYRAVRDDGGIGRVRMPNDEEAWLVTRHEYVRRLLSDAAVSADRSAPGYPVFPGVPSREIMVSHFRGGLMGMDRPEHSLHRRLLVPEFTVRHVERLSPRVQRIVDLCVDGLLADGPGADLVQHVALPVPARVICDMLGMPVADHAFIDEQTKITFDRHAPVELRQAAGERLREVFRSLVRDKERAPGDDLLSTLIARYRAAGRYDSEQMAGMAGGLLSGGHETTAGTIALSVLALLRHPDQRALATAGPQQLSAAVEELLRVFSPLAEFAGYRAARADIEVGAVVIRAGEGIIAHVGAANRDAAEFADPDRIDVTRAASRQLAFGYGIHQCLGQHLARLQLRLTLGTLFARVPDLRLAVPFAELPFKDEFSIYGLHQLPVAW